MNNLGIMQGRLSSIVNNKIQSFPERSWTSEFSKIHKLKIRNLEWTLDYKNFYKNPLIDVNQHKKIFNLKKKYKIRINSVTCDCMMQKPFWKIKNNKKLLSDFKKIIISCSKLNLKYLVVPLVDNGRLETKKEENYFVSKMHELTQFIKNNKVEVIFESDYKPERLQKFVKRFDLKAFGINYDTGNSAALNYDIDEEFKFYGRFIKNIHIKDRLKLGNTVRLGKGNTNFKKLLKNIKKIKYKKKLILQTARSHNGNHVKEIEANILFLKEKNII